MTEFASTATGDLEIDLIDAAAKFHATGEYQAGRNTYSDVKVDVVAGASTATVTACIDANGTANYKVMTTTLDPASNKLKVTGSQLLQRVSGPKFETRTTMTLIDGRWMATADSAVANC